MIVCVWINRNVTLFARLVEVVSRLGEGASAFAKRNPLVSLCSMTPLFIFPFVWLVLCNISYLNFEAGDMWEWMCRPYFHHLTTLENICVPFLNLIKVMTDILFCIQYQVILQFKISVKYGRKNTSFSKYKNTYKIDIACTWKGWGTLDPIWLKCDISPTCRSRSSRIASHIEVFLSLCASLSRGFPLRRTSPCSKYCFVNHQKIIYCFLIRKCLYLFPWQHIAKEQNSRDRDIEIFRDWDVNKKIEI